MEWNGAGSVRLKVAVVGTGISGLSAAWLLSQRHDVTVYEQADRVGGHSNTVIAVDRRTRVPVDTGFIVFNRADLSESAALFEHLPVPTQPPICRSPSRSDDGDLEYSGTGLARPVRPAGAICSARASGRCCAIS